MEWVGFIGICLVIAWWLWGSRLKKFAPSPLKNSPGELQKAQTAMDDNDLDTALTHLNTAIKTDPNNPVGYIKRGQARVKMEDYDRAIADFDRALKIDPHAQEAHVRKGHALLHLEQFEGATHSFTETIRLIEEEHARVEKYGVYMNMRDTGKNQLLTSTYQLRGHSHQQTGHMDDALRDLRYAYELDPDYTPTRKSLAFHFNATGSGHYEAGDMDAAITDFMAALDYYAEIASIHNNLGEAYFCKGNYTGASDYFDRALSLDPDLTIAHAGKAVTLFALGEKDTARQMWNELLTDDDQYGNITYVKETFRWSDALAEEARRLIDSTRTT